MSELLLIDDDEHLGPPLAAFFRRFDFELQHATRPSQGLLMLAGGGDHAPQSPVGERKVRRLVRRALRDLDEGDRPPALGDEVDLAASHLRAPRQDAPAVQAQPPGGDRLGPPPAPFGLGPAQASPPSSSARA